MVANERNLIAEVLILVLCILWSFFTTYRSRIFDYSVFSISRCDEKQERFKGFLRQNK